jgi:hypothetical protein
MMMQLVTAGSTIYIISKRFAVEAFWTTWNVRIPRFVVAAPFCPLARRFSRSASFSFISKDF